MPSKTKQPPPSKTADATKGSSAKKANSTPAESTAAKKAGPAKGTSGKAASAGKSASGVYEDEPVLGAKHPLIGMENALCTPHLGYVERDFYDALLGAAVDQILAFAAGHPVNVVNPEVLPRP